MVSAASWLAFRQRSSRTPSRQRTRRVPCASTRQRLVWSTAALTAAITASSAAPCTRAVRSAAQLRANSTCKSGSRYSRMVLRRKCSTANGWKPCSVMACPPSAQRQVPAPAGRPRPAGTAVRPGRAPPARCTPPATEAACAGPTRRSRPGGEAAV